MGKKLDLVENLMDCLRCIPYNEDTKELNGKTGVHLSIIDIGNKL